VGGKDAEWKTLGTKTMHDPICHINLPPITGVSKPCNCGYDKFVESMVQFCHCEPYAVRPCDGILAGGMCDGAREDRFEIQEEEDD
jgi:hypothetical protein